MKKYIAITITMIIAAFIAGFLISHKDVVEAEVERPLVMAMTASIEVPEQMTFAGEKIEFDRYDIYEKMDREINSFTYFHSTTLLLFKRANRIFPIIEPILKKQGMPDDLKYLAVIESNLDPRAVSPARAAGLWQFMAGTAPQYGLEVNSEVDERYHIEKSTVAACRYLRDAYNKYGSWAAAAMSYNGGQGRITTEMSRQNAEGALDLWLVEETSRYYFRMMAIKQVFENPQQYGFVIRPHQLYKPLDYAEVTVSEAIPDLAAFARQQGVTYAHLKDANSWLRDRKLTNKSGKTYTILIPEKESLYYRRGQKAKVHNPAWVVN